MTPSELYRTCCADLGYDFGTEQSLYAHGAVLSTLRNWESLPQLPMAFSPEMSRAERKAARKAFEAAKDAREKALRRIIIQENAQKCGFDPQEAMKALDTKEKAGLIAAVIIWLVAGPIELFVVAICAVAGWALESELEKKFGENGIAKCAAAFNGGAQ